MTATGRYPPVPYFPPIAFYSAVRLGDPEQLAKVMESDPYFITQDNGAGAPLHFATTYKQLDMVRGARWGLIDRRGAAWPPPLARPPAPKASGQTPGLACVAFAALQITARLLLPGLTAMAWRGAAAIDRAAAPIDTLPRRPPLPLPTAAQVHHLLNNGAEVNQRDDKGFTPLHRAAYLAHYDGYLEIYEYLLASTNGGLHAGLHACGSHGCRHPRAPRFIRLP